MAEVSKSAATLRIFGDDLDPDWVTRKLGSEPSFSVRKGEVHEYPPHRKVDRIAQTGIWRISAPRVQPADLDHQIALIVSGLTADLDVWSDLGKRFHVDLFCGLWLEEGNEVAELSPKSSLILGERGISVVLDIYGPARSD